MSVWAWKVDSPCGDLAESAEAPSEMLPMRPIAVRLSGLHTGSDRKKFSGPRKNTSGRNPRVTSRRKPRGRLRPCCVTPKVAHFRPGAASWVYPGANSGHGSKSRRFGRQAVRYLSARSRRSPISPGWVALNSSILLPKRCFIQKPLMPRGGRREATARSIPGLKGGQWRPIVRSHGGHGICPTLAAHAYCFHKCSAGLI